MMLCCASKVFFVFFQRKEQSCALAFLRVLPTQLKKSGCLVKALFAPQIRALIPDLTESQTAQINTHTTPRHGDELMMDCIQ